MPHFCPYCGFRASRPGALPLIGHFAARMGVRRLLDTCVPADHA
jgi:hypothetical protein